MSNFWRFFVVAVGCGVMYSAGVLSMHPQVVTVPQPYPYPVEVRESCPPPADQPDFTGQVFPDAGMLLFARPIPEKPVKDQLLAPCDKSLNLKELNGTCWIETADKVPCPKGRYTDGQRCYIPAVAPPAPPSSETKEDGGKR